MQKALADNPTPPLPPEAPPRWTSPVSRATQQLSSVVLALRAAVTAAASSLVSERLLLPDDATSIIENANSVTIQ